MSGNKVLVEGMFGAGSVKNTFTAVDRAKRAYREMLATTRTLIKADYGDNYIENIDEGFFGVSRFLTIIGLLGYKPNTVGTVLEGTGRDGDGPSHYVYGCPDMKRPDKKYNLYVRPRHTAQDSIGSLVSFLGLVVEGLGLNLECFFPEVASINEEDKVSIKDRNYPITYIALSPITGINCVVILGISDRDFLHVSDIDILNKLKASDIKPAQKNKILDDHFEDIFSKFIRGLYSEDKICAADPLDIFSTDPQSLFGMLLGGMAEVTKPESSIIT